MQPGAKRKVHKARNKAASPAQVRARRAKRAWTPINEPYSPERYAAQKRALLPKREPERGSRSRYTTFDDGERVSVKARPVGVETSRRRH